MGESGWGCGQALGIATGGALLLASALHLNNARVWGIASCSAGRNLRGCRLLRVYVRLRVLPSILHMQIALLSEFCC